MKIDDDGIDIGGKKKSLLIYPNKNKQSKEDPKRFKRELRKATAELEGSDENLVDTIHNIPDDSIARIDVERRIVDMTQQEPILDTVVAAGYDPENNYFFVVFRSDKADKVEKPEDLIPKYIQSRLNLTIQLLHIIEDNTKENNKVAEDIANNLRRFGDYKTYFIDGGDSSIRILRNETDENRWSENNILFTLENRLEIMYRSKLRPIRGYREVVNYQRSQNKPD